MVYSGLLAALATWSFCDPLYVLVSALTTNPSRVGAGAHRRPVPQGCNHGDRRRPAAGCPTSRLSDVGTYPAYPIFSRLLRKHGKAQILGQGSNEASHK